MARVWVLVRLDRHPAGWFECGKVLVGWIANLLVQVGADWDGKTVASGLEQHGGGRGQGYAGSEWPPAHPTQRGLALHATFAPRLSLQSLPADFVTTMEEYVKDAPRVIDPSDPNSYGKVAGGKAPADMRSSSIARQGGVTSGALAGEWERGRGFRHGRGRAGGSNSNAASLLRCC